MGHYLVSFIIITLITSISSHLYSHSFHKLIMPLINQNNHQQLKQPLIILNNPPFKFKQSTRQKSIVQYILMNDYFVFPVNFEDVEQENHGRHYVHSESINLSEKQIILELKRIDTAGFQNYEDICNHENFDVLYHLIKGYHENIESRSMRVLEKLSETLHHLATVLLKECQRVSSEQSIEPLRVSFKMVMFLILFYITAVAKCKQKTTQADMIAEAIAKDKKKKGNKNDVELSRGVIHGMKMMVTLIRDTLGIDYKTLWERKQVDPEFFKRYTDVCVKVLESSIARDDQVINSIFEILELILKQKPQLFLNIQRVLINLVYQTDMTDILVHFFSRAETPELQRLCTETVICVVVYLVAKNLNSESSSIKNTRQFLSKLSQKIPRMFYNNLSCFIRLYQHQSYHLRNAISDILMNILLNLKEESMEKARQKFLNTLLQRIYDKSSFCRWHVLGILNQLALERAVPNKYVVMFLKAGADRIKDHSVNTRKKALQLINSIIEDVWPEDQTLRPLQIIEQDLKATAMNKQTAQSQLEAVHEAIQGQNYEDELELNKLTRQENLLTKTIQEQQQRQANLSQQKQIVTLIQEVLQKVRILLSSKTDTDVLETIRLFIKFYKRKIQYCKECLPHIRLLIFSREKKIKDEVLTTFTQLHLIKNTSQEIANQLIELFREATPQDASALQEIIQIIVTESLSKNIAIIKPQVYSLLWNKFVHYERTGDQASHKRAILTVLRIAYNKDPLMIKQQNIVSFLGILKSYIAKNQPDFIIVREIIKIIMVQPETCRVIDANSRNLILATICILVGSQDSPNQEWYSVSEHILTCIYKISPNPEKLTEVFIKKLHDNLLQKNSSSISVAHFLFTLSHSCLKMLIHLDSLESKVKTIKAQESQNGQQMVDENEEELDKVVGGVQAELQMRVNEIQRLGEKIIADPFISRWVKVVQNISNSLQTGNQLQIIAVLSYCKFMCISAEYCQTNFPYLLKILNKPKIDSVIKNNIIIAIGDLLHRFPNIVEPYSKFLYQNLHDGDVRVRKTTLTVLTHLALNDMIKVKGDICDIAALFQDKDPEIQSLVRQFFSEVNRKDPKYLFNIIPQALVRFSDLQKFRGTNDKTFTVFLQNVLPLMEKDKYSESLIGKLCERISTSLNILQVKNAAYCLSQINMNEKGLRKLIQSFNEYKRTLETPQVMTYFKNLVTKLKKSSKGDIKSLVEQLEQKINNSNDDVFNADEIKKRNERNQKKPKKKGPGRKSRNEVATGSRKKGRKGRKNDEEDEEEEDSMEEESNSQKIKNTSQNAQSSQRPRRNAAKKPIIIEEDNEEQEDQDDLDRFDD